MGQSSEEGVPLLLVETIGSFVSLESSSNVFSLPLKGASLEDLGSALGKLFLRDSASLGVVASSPGS